MQEVTRNSQPFPLSQAHPEEWKNIAIPITETICLLLKEVHRLGLRDDEHCKQLASLKQKQQEEEQRAAKAEARAKELER